MKNLCLFLIMIFFVSCNVSNFIYTSDDVYFSSSNIKTTDNYVDLNDRYLYMKSRGNRWQTFDNDFYYWNLPNNRFNNWYPNPYTFNSWNYTPYFYWRNRNLFYYNPYGNINNTINIKHNNRTYYPPTKVLQDGPRQFNLRTFDNNSGTVSPTKKPTTSSSAPIRKFNQQ